jgi:hypothetical protein
MYLWQGNKQIYGNVRSIYTDLANPMHVHVVMYRTRDSRYLGHFVSNIRMCPHFSAQQQAQQKREAQQEGQAREKREIQ